MRFMRLCLICYGEFPDPRVTVCPKDGTVLPRHSDPMMGAVVGGVYEVRSRIHEGSGRVVYRAERNDGEQIVAVKTFQLIPDEANYSYEQFQRVMKDAASWSHPQIVKLLSVGVQPQGLPFAITEFIPPEAFLDRVLTGGPLVPSYAVQICIQLAEILEVAHDKGILHRGIKPSNIALDVSGNFGVKLMDFGFSQTGLDLSLTKCQPLGPTQSSTYMSPEQCMGKKLFATSDIYSLGINLFEWLVGAPPFKGRNSIEAASMHMSSQVPRFKEVNPARNIPIQLEVIVMRMLAKYPEVRYQSMSSLKFDLQEALKLTAGESVRK